VIARTAALAALLLAAYAPAMAQPTAQSAQNGEQWTPVPPVVTPAATPTAPPSDAIVLFDGASLSEWVNARDNAPAGWTVADGVLTVEKRAGDIETKRKFRDYQLHLEWRVPLNVTGSGQSRGNSGVFLASTGPEVSSGYELQILDSYNNPTYVNGQAASVYKQSPPLANAMRPPGQWQVYDIVWTAPTFGPDGKLKTPGRVTAFHNGVLVQNDFAVLGETAPAKPYYRAYDRAPIKLQAHGDPSPPISFRNIWVRELP
jgi:hypothetical protein